MKTRADPALTEALALIRAPRSVRPGAEQRLPEGILLLLRIVAGEEEALAIGQESTRQSADSLREAAAFYIQQVLFASDSSSYRVLGVDQDVSDERLREHYRWLARWLHPDRNPDAWEVVYADRVTQAWQDVRTPERRMRYDQKRRESAEFAGEVVREAAKVVRRAGYPTTSAPRMNLRWLPAAVFGGLGVSAILIVSLFYVLRWAEPGRHAVIPAPPAVAIVLPGQSPESVSIDMDSIAPTEQAESDAAVPTLFYELPSSVADENHGLTPAQDVQLAVGSTAAAAVTAAPNPVAAPRPEVSVPQPERQLSQERKAATESQVEAGAKALALPTSRTNPPAVAKSESRVATGDVRRTGAPAVSPAAPAAEGALVSRSETSAESISQRDANRVLGHFSQAYSDGDIARMRAMFTADVSSPRGGLDTILAEYNTLFESSEERSLAVRDVSWFANGETFTIIASYNATVSKGRSRRPRRTHGDLRLDLRMEDEQWRIYRLQHDERPG